MENKSDHTIKDAIYHWLPVLAWCSLIFYLSGTPNLKTDLGTWDLVLRKIAHLTEYGILFLLARRAIAGTFSLSSGKVYAIAILFSVAYAASDEIHQSFVPTRGPSFGDVVIDIAGVLLGFLLYRRWRQSRAGTKKDVP